MESKRTECVFFHVTPEVKAKIDIYNDDDKMKEEIIRQYIETEKDWMNDSLKDFDESELLYRCSLVRIKDSFNTAQGEYLEEINKLYEEADKQTKTLIDKLSKPKEMLSKMKKELDSFKDELKELPSLYELQNINEIFSIIEKYNSLSIEDKELLIKIINKK